MVKARYRRKPSLPWNPRAWIHWITGCCGLLQGWVVLFFPQGWVVSWGRSACRVSQFKLIYNYHRQVSHCWLSQGWLYFHRVDCSFTWLTEVSQGTVKLIRYTAHISLGLSQGAQEFHMMLLRSHFQLKFSQHISQYWILYHFLYHKYILISEDVSHSKLGSHGFHMLFTCFSQGLS